MHTGSIPEVASRSATPTIGWIEARGRDAETDVPVAIGQPFAGRYMIEGTLGAGGMGVVCLGRHIELDQPVAIKFLKRALTTNPMIVQRFLNEGRAAAALRSAHVVRVMDVGLLESGQPYLVMERLNGTDLDGLLEKRGPLPIEQAVDYALQACVALSESHSAGIIHRDVKPENLFLCKTESGKDAIKLVDFGLAKRMTGARANVVTGPQDGMGSPCYMSPEQIVSARSVDGRTDIWAMGIVLYRLVSGRLPFDGESLSQICGRILNQDPVPLSEACPGVPPELERIVERCLKKNVIDRYQRVQDLAKDLGVLRARRSGDSRPDVPTAVVERAEATPRHSAWPIVMLFSALGVAATARTVTTHDVGKWIADRFTMPTLAGTEDVPVRRVWAVELPVVASASTAAPVSVVAPAASAAAIPVSAPAADSHARSRSNAHYPVPAAPILPEPALTPDEIARRKAEYDAYLKSHGMTPLRDVLKKLDPQ